MPKPLIHLLIPMAALIIAGFNRKNVIILSPLAVIADTDLLFGAHRSILHSFFILGPISLILIFYSFKYRSDWKSSGIIISIYLLSHPLLDLFTGPIQLLWPLDIYYYLYINPPTIDPITNAINFGSFFIQFLVLTPETVGGYTEVNPIPIFENVGLISLILIGLAITYWLIKNKYEKKNTKINDGGI
ncbi:MAG: hypothetical protein GF329_11555 [Candidatus Lokiarchaeota archaeon]|nr:hypothetical protein [Candidatus Lokiarchaeota archaeon]